MKEEREGGGTLETLQRAVRQVRNEWKQDLAMD